MIIGIGLDLVEMERIDKLRRRQERFSKRILTKVEWKLYHSLSEKRKTEFLAGRFAAKEAYSKAIGTGIGKELSFQDIEIIPDEKGKPRIVKPIGNQIHVSITHTKTHAAAQVIIEDK